MSRILGGQTLGFLEKGIQTPVAQGRSTKNIMSKWIRTSRLSIKDSLSEALGQLGQDEPASGMALEPLDGLSPISGSVAIGIHHRNSNSL